MRWPGCCGWCCPRQPPRSGAFVGAFAGAFAGAFVGAFVGAVVPLGALDGCSPVYPVASAAEFIAPCGVGVAPSPDVTGGFMLAPNSAAGTAWLYRRRS